MVPYYIPPLTTYRIFPIPENESHYNNFLLALLNPGRHYMQKVVAHSKDVM
jgi:hypothetical protein